MDERQKVLARQLNDNDGGDRGIANITAVVFNKEACRRAMVKMIIVDELPFSFVEGVGFRKFIGCACPRFDIPSRRTVTRDILKLYSEEKEILKDKLISNKQRVCLTTDCWTSIQNISYMVITAHFIDKNWMLHKRILNFSVIPNHKGETIGKLIEKCLLDWGIENVSTITIDNASANDGAIVYIKKILKNWKVDGMVLGGSFMHVRCCAHIVNLIVNDGLKEFNVAIASIRNAVKYFRSSPSRLAKFKICVEREKIERKKLAMLDVPTRWNATYLMLDSALKFEKTFDRMAEEDGFYCKYFDEERENGKEREGPPNIDDWEKGRKFVKFLKTFYETTLKFSASLSVTSNLYFKEVCNIQHLLKTLSDRQDPILSDMAKNMKSKFDKYWGSVEKMNKILIIAVVLDPRYKLEFVGYCIGRLYDNILVESTKDEIKNLLYELYNQYKGWHSASSHGDGGICDFNDSLVEVSANDDWDESNNFDSGYKKLKSSHTDLLGKDEIQRYLMEPTEDSTNPNFDILTWWKLNCPRYEILSEIAKDVLAIPVSTVVSESAFSTGWRVLDSFRSSLTPKTIEALICTQNWLRSTLLGDRLYGVGIEETEFHEELIQLETELVKKRTHMKDDSMVVELD